MQIRIVAVGKLREAYVARACADFEQRLRPYHSVEIAAVRASDGTRPQTAIDEEGERIARRLAAGERYWLLDREGTELSSDALSAKLLAAEHGSRRLTLVIAGTYGASAALRERAEFRWSLSQLTFLHEWARMIVLEQLYRATKIARNEPYHH